ncbi:hypothetical protein [Streptomyces sp. AC495_CC817]|uniref:hypothetical protein n=1 Tax=Streptomyces sp. AC495_CC817 TaxID=2823900 RepID=UPI001C25A039|nr:hypothetical protein [Streptomyces sp. AC495_CC817]
MKLDPDRVREWVRADSTRSLFYGMKADKLVTDPDELRAAVEAGMQISISGGSDPKEETSLAFLLPVIADLQDLWIGTTTRIVDIDVLNKADKLRSLAFSAGSCAGQAELARLPRLEQFDGIVTRSVASVLKNPSLRFVNVQASIPRSYAQIVGPVEIFVQEGGRQQVDLPVFHQPDAMRVLTRIGPASFDVSQLENMTRLEEFELSLCGKVTNLDRLSHLPALRRVAFKACSTSERWEVLPKIARAMLLDVAPMPSTEFLDERRDAGWIVPTVEEAAPGPALFLDEAGDGESWGVFLSRFEDLASAVNMLDGSAATGLHGESFLLGIALELRSDGISADVVPDSESDRTAVYFLDLAQAEQVFVRARELLAADPATQLHYLRAGQEFCRF